MTDLCGWCGKLHEGDCDQPVTEPPPGLFGANGELTRLGAVMEDAANYLAMRGYLDPDAEEWPNWVLADLAGLYQAGPCQFCSEPLNGSDLADHFLARKQEQWERSVPAWTCDCGRKFKVIPSGPGEEYYEARGDGLMGGIVGCVKLDPKRQKVKHSDACPDCKRRFADTVADQLNPQKALF